MSKKKNKSQKFIEVSEGVVLMYKRNKFIKIIHNASCVNKNREKARKAKKRSYELSKRFDNLIADIEKG